MTVLAGRVLALAAAVAVGAAGCTSSGAHSARPPGSSTHARATSPRATLPADVTPATNVPTAVPNKPAWRKNVVVTTCTAADHGWAAHGTVRNPAKRALVYHLTVFFTTTSATVLGVGRARVRVLSGATQPWQATGRFTAPNKVLCVLRGVS